MRSEDAIFGGNSVGLDNAKDPSPMAYIPVRFHKYHQQRLGSSDSPTTQYPQIDWIQRRRRGETEGHAKQAILAVQQILDTTATICRDEANDGYEFYISERYGVREAQSTSDASDYEDDMTAPLKRPRRQA
ncbi:unnamed protein product [Phytophthora fragariaefolia]|uniref:Unnamed protein product n=1 Tax=Phytophthora fragariaefolia TaxID=1490495 RepID=A0A9W6XZ84_9STRA|nr:unnamed protein product [Phytophthora fragariaefolia]